jgi:hypothetical protein
MVNTLSPQSNNQCLYHTEVSMHNTSKIYHPKIEHLNANDKIVNISPNFFFSFLYGSMVHEGSQNIQTIK